MEINTSNLSNGLYICKLIDTSKGESFNVKMIVQH